MAETAFAAKDRQITSQMIRLEKAIEDLAHTIEQVEGRLNSILRQEDGTKGPGEPEQELVPLANQIGEQAHQIERQSDRLKSVLDRVEL